MKTIRYWIITFLWMFKKIKRNHCWADAVVWAYSPSVSDLFRKSDHKCFYCGACNTESEMKAYQSQFSEVL